MTPKILLKKLMKLNQGDSIDVSNEDLVYLKIAHNIDASVLMRPKPFNTYRIIKPLCQLLDSVSDNEPKKINIGYRILCENSSFTFVVRAFMDYCYCYRVYDLVDHLNCNEAWIDYNIRHDSGEFYISYYYETRLTSIVEKIAVSLGSVTIG